MASSTPSRARIANVLEALAALGHRPRRIVVAADGGFSVEILRDGIALTADKVQNWTRQAGLENRSSHGLRKSLAELLAQQGATSHQIMSVLAHTQSKTTEIYTKGAERTRLAKAAMDAIVGFRIG